MAQISNMPRKIGEWINMELHNAQLYRVLARSAPNDREKHILEDFSDDSQDTAETLMRIYKKTRLQRGCFQLAREQLKRIYKQMSEQD